jgi:hypothetical protein
LNLRLQRAKEHRHRQRQPPRESGSDAPLEARCSR